MTADNKTLTKVITSRDVLVGWDWPQFGQFCYSCESKYSKNSSKNQIKIYWKLIRKFRDLSHICLNLRPIWLHLDPTWHRWWQKLDIVFLWRNSSTRGCHASHHGAWRHVSHTPAESQCQSVSLHVARLWLSWQLFTDTCGNPRSQGGLIGWTEGQICHEIGQTRKCF